MKLKVCGMKYGENIINVADLKPDYMGFIFYEKSPRFVNENTPESLHSIKKTGVFVNASLNYIIEQIDLHKLQAIQLHGNESPKFCASLRNAFLNSVSNPIEIIKVFSIKDEFNFIELQPYESVCDYYLFDTKGKLPGGNGYAFDWSILEKYPSTKPFFLSGGIGLDQLENIKAFQKSKASTYCYAFDVNSGFEIEPGLKSINMLKEFKSQL